MYKKENGLMFSYFECNQNSKVNVLITSMSKIAQSHRQVKVPLPGVPLLVERLLFLLLC